MTSKEFLAETNNEIAKLATEIDVLESEIQALDDQRTPKEIRLRAVKIMRQRLQQFIQVDGRLDDENGIPF